MKNCFFFLNIFSSCNYTALKLMKLEKKKKTHKICFYENVILLFKPSSNSDCIFF